MNWRLFGILAVLLVVGQTCQGQYKATESQSEGQLIREKRAPLKKLALLGGAALIGKKALLVGGGALGAKALLGAGALGAGALGAGALGAGLYKGNSYGGGYGGGGGHGGPSYVSYPSYHQHYHEHYEPHVDYHVAYPQQNYPSHGGWDYAQGWY